MIITIKNLNTQLDEKPNDWNLRLILADAYGDNGQWDMEEYYRWTVNLQIAPEKRKYHYMLFNGYFNGRCNLHAIVSMFLYERLKNHLIDSLDENDNYRFYNTRQEAELDLFHARQL